MKPEKNDIYKKEVTVHRFRVKDKEGIKDPKS